MSINVAYMNIAGACAHMALLLNCSSAGLEKVFFLNRIIHTSGCLFGKVLYLKQFVLKTSAIANKTHSQLYSYQEVLKLHTNGVYRSDK